MQLNKKIWDAFVATEAKDYEEAVGISVQDIKRIGWRKFVKANDWKTAADVSKWRTDTLFVYKCPHCGTDFGVFDYTLALCDRCLPLFDLKALYEDINEFCTGSQERYSRALMMFMGDVKFRSIYLKSSRRKMIDAETKT